MSEAPGVGTAAGDQNRHPVGAWSTPLAAVVWGKETPVGGAERCSPCVRRPGRCLCVGWDACFFALDGPRGGQFVARYVYSHYSRMSCMLCQTVCFPESRIRSFDVSLFRKHEGQSNPARADSTFSTSLVPTTSSPRAGHPSSPQTLSSRFAWHISFNWSQASQVRFQPCLT